MGLIAFSARVALSVFFVFLAAFSFVSGHQLCFEEGGHAKVIASYHPYQSERLRESLMDLVATNSSADYDPQIKELARISPIDPLPYEILLAQSKARGDLKASQLFAGHVLSLQPRSLSGHIYLFSVAAERREYSSVISHFERLVALNSLNSDLLSDAVVGVFRDSGDWSELVDYISAEPALGDLLAAKLLKEGLDRKSLEEVLLKYPHVQDEYLRKLVEEKKYAQAHQAWQKFSAPFEASLNELPFNGDLLDRPERAPFNWAVLTKRTEFQERGGLFVTFLGRRSPVFAQQLFSAPPGRYSLQTIALGRMPQNGGALEWRLSCLENGKELGRVTINLNRILEEEAFETQVVVPDVDCAFQRIQLKGLSGQFPKMSKTQVLSVRLVPVEF